MFEPRGKGKHEKMARKKLKFVIFEAFPLISEAL